MPLPPTTPTPEAAPMPTLVERLLTAPKPSLGAPMSDAAKPMTPENRTKTPREVVATTLSFFGSCIRCGEPWDDLCQKMMDSATAALANMDAPVRAPTDERSDDAKRELSDEQKVADARYFEGGQDLSNDPIHVAAVDLQIALLAASEAAHRLTVIARDSEEALAAHRKGAA